MKFNILYESYSRFKQISNIRFNHFIMEAWNSMFKFAGLLLYYDKIASNAFYINCLVSIKGYKRLVCLFHRFFLNNN
jgi:hypothetical protein